MCGELEMCEIKLFFLLKLLNGTTVKNGIKNGATLLGCKKFSPFFRFGKFVELGFNT